MPVVNENEYDTRPAKNHLYSNHEVDEPKDDDEPGDYDHLFGKGKKALNSVSTLRCQINRGGGSFTFFLITLRHFRE